MVTYSSYTVSELLFNSFEPSAVGTGKMFPKAHGNKAAPLIRTELHRNKQGGLIVCSVVF